MTVQLPAPLLVEGVDEGWHDRPQPYRDAVMAWMRESGIDPNDTRRIEVFLVDAPFARVTSYVRENGAIVCRADRTEPEMVTETVILSSLPPRL